LSEYVRGGIVTQHKEPKVCWGRAWPSSTSSSNVPLAATARTAFCHVAQGAKGVFEALVPAAAAAAAAIYP
jgi:hypothetical protein